MRVVSLVKCGRPALVIPVMKVGAPPVAGIQTRSVITSLGLISSLTIARSVRGARAATIRDPVGEYMMSS